MTRKAQTRLWISLAFLCVSLSAIYWATQPVWHRLREEHRSKSYLDRLVTEVDGADQIDLVEHSWYHAVKDDSGTTWWRPEPIEFRRITLSSQQRREFSEMIRNTNPARKTSVCPGMLDVHHTIYVKKSGEIHSRIDLCFDSEEVDWYIGQKTPPVPVSGPYPEDLLPRMRKWIISLGMTPDANWQQLAEQPGSAATQPAEKVPPKDQPPTPRRRMPPGSRMAGPHVLQ